MDLARTLLAVDPNNKCFANNYFICCALQNTGQIVFPNAVLKADKSDNHFLDYNYAVILETDPTHNFKIKPTLKSKLLFMDYRFNKYSPSTLYFINGNNKNFKESEIQKPIIKFGRANFEVNDVGVPGGNSISRRHCVIINFKDDVWVYDLESTGTYLNEKRLKFKAPLIGRNKILIGRTEFEFTNDKSKLF